MSKSRDVRQESPPVNEREVADIVHKAENHLPPLKPRRGLFILFAILLVVLLAGMLTMYFTTVYPYRYKPHSVELDKTSEPAGQK